MSEMLKHVGNTCALPQLYLIEMYFTYIYHMTFGNMNIWLIEIYVLYHSCGREYLLTCVLLHSQNVSSYLQPVIDYNL